MGPTHSSSRSVRAAVGVRRPAALSSRVKGAGSMRTAHSSPCRGMDTASVPSPVHVRSMGARTTSAMPAPKYRGLERVGSTST